MVILSIRYNCKAICCLICFIYLFKNEACFVHLEESTTTKTRGIVGKLLHYFQSNFTCPILTLLLCMCLLIYLVFVRFLLSFFDYHLHEF